MYPLVEAVTMVDAFASVGADRFDLTLKTLEGEKRSFRRNVSSRKLKTDLCDLVQVAERDCLSLIVRPHSKATTFIQLDDISEDTASRLVPYSCCVVETSEGNYQAFIAVLGLDRAGKQTVRDALIEAANADPGASGATRLAGSLNFKKQRRRVDGTYPRVRLVSAASSRVFSVPELVAAGLMRFQLKTAPRPAVAMRKKPPRRHIFPNYERTIHYVRLKEDGSIDRSAVDLLFAVTCLDWDISPEQTIKLLHKQSVKAAERFDDYAERTVAKAQVLVDEKRALIRRRERQRRAAANPS